MKLKLTIALVILALVFGMVLAACDDGEVVTITEQTKSISGTTVYTEKIYDRDYVPYINGNAKPQTGIIEGVPDDTTANPDPITLQDVLDTFPY
jgi:hypothetical protein